MRPWVDALRSEGEGPSSVRRPSLPPRTDAWLTAPLWRASSCNRLQWIIVLYLTCAVLYFTLTAVCYSGCFLSNLNSVIYHYHPLKVVHASRTTQCRLCFNFSVDIHSFTTYIDWQLFDSWLLLLSFFSIRFILYLLKVNLISYQVVFCDFVMIIRLFRILFSLCFICHYKFCFCKLILIFLGRKICSMYQKAKNN